MKTASRLLLASLASFGLVGTAIAQDDAPVEATADGSADEASDPNAAPAVSPDPNALAPAGRWPRAVILRPLTLPSGVFMAGADIVNYTSSFFDPAFIRVVVGYGITDDLELGFAHYAFPTSDVGKGAIAAGLGYKLVRGGAGGKLEAIGRATIGYDLAASIDLTTGETSGAVTPLGLGVHVRYMINDKIALITPGDQLQIGLDPNFIDLSLPVAVGFQATPELYAQLATNIATINIKDSGTAVIFADTTPIELTATYNVMPALDVTAGLAFNLTPPGDAGIGDTLAILIGARYYAGAL